MRIDNNNKIKLNPNNLNLRRGCFWYPCHQGISNEEYDCRQCYCSLYNTCRVIRNESTGGYLFRYIDNEDKEQSVWACEKCTLLHNKDNVDLYFKLKNKGFNDEKILDILIENRS